MTAADKLRELLTTRPATPKSYEELMRWWKFGGEAVQELLAGFPATGRAIVALERDRADRGDEIERLRAELQAIDCDLVAERAELRRERDARAQLRVELDRERVQHEADLREANWRARDAQLQAMDRGASFQAVSAELESLRPVLKEALDNWYRYVADIANTPSSRTDSGNAEHVSWAKRECERIVELSRMTAPPAAAAKEAARG